LPAIGPEKLPGNAPKPLTLLPIAPRWRNAVELLTALLNPPTSFANFLQTLIYGGSTPLRAPEKHLQTQLGNSIAYACMYK